MILIQNKKREGNHCAWHVRDGRGYWECISQESIHSHKFIVTDDGDAPVGDEDKCVWQVVGCPMDMRRMVDRK